MALVPSTCIPPKLDLVALSTFCGFPPSNDVLAASAMLVAMGTVAIWIARLEKA